MSSNESLSPEHSLAQNGKSFHWAGRLLGAQTGRDAARLYSICRVLDDMADGDIDNGPRRLDQIRAGLTGDASAQDPLLLSLMPFVAAQGISTAVLVALIDGLLEDQQDVALADETALLRYSYRVAGTVGLMMCNVLGCDNRAAFAHAVDLGIAMQLTNIARDVIEDAQMGRRYLPGTWLDNMTPAEILAADDPQREMISLAVARLLRLAEVYYASGTAGLVYLPLRAHLAISVAARVYRQIGIQLAAKGCRWYAGREVTSKPVKLGCSIRALTSLPDRARAYKAHDARLHAALTGLPHVG